MLKQALEIRRTALGNDSPEVARTLTNLANLYRKMKRLKEAEEMYAESLEIRTRVFGENHSEVASTYNAMAQLFQYKREYGRVEELYRKAIEINTATVGGGHPNTIQNRVNLANTLRSQPGREPEALVEFRKAYVATREMPGEARRHSRMGSIVPLFARGLVKQAKRHLGKQEKEEALGLLEEAQSVYQSQQGKEWGKRLAEIDRLKQECVDGTNGEQLVDESSDEEADEEVEKEKPVEPRVVEPPMVEVETELSKVPRPSIADYQWLGPGVISILLLLVLMVWMALGIENGMGGEL
eukprot:TRINITY_DN1340_c0_g4_i3.p1 TRINITY_DN1340_c0_g4~~TRINITY_DN1340_c0_g4_i3.p1  ORF type:complete len:297 (+),score=84.74 TRINITY_DN1340_c0_g4_i3:1099-1989(+)